MALTEAEREYQRNWKRADYHAKTAAGICLRCGAELETGTRRCWQCRDAQQADHRKRMARQAAPCRTQGCDGKATPRSTTGQCLACSRAAKVAVMLAAKRDTGMGRTYTDQGATFSDDRVMRFTLWRRWDGGMMQMAPKGTTALWVMLNPSTADEAVLDPTVRRCEDFSRAWGYGGFVVCNLFALRSTDPRALYRHNGDPTGDHPDDRNLHTILEQAMKADLVVAAWGTHGRYMDRGAQVADLLMVAPNVYPKLHHLGRNADGSPKHPLYIPGKTTPERWL
jgi:hypothetical protein